MKILLTANDITGKGGVERVVCNLANAFDELGFEVEILSFYQNGKELLYNLNPKVKLTFLKGVLDIHTKKPFLRFFTKTLYRFYLAYKMKQRYKDKEIIIYNCYFYPYFKNKNTKYIKIHHQVFKRSYSFKNKIFDVNIILARKEINRWQKKLNNISIIPNFLPIIPKENANLHSKIVLSIGRMSENDEKRFLYLIEIWQKIQEDEGLKEWKLHIVGDGNLKGQIQAKIKALNLENSIILKPFTQEIQKEYLNASIYAMTSRNEGLPMVLLEASSYALACIGFDVLTGVSDIIDDEKTGFLIQDNDLNSYVNKLTILMNDENLRVQMGRNAKEKIKNEFSKEVVMQKWIQLFEKQNQSL